MMSGLVPTTTMCWLFSWDMGSFAMRGEREGVGQDHQPGGAEHHDRPSVHAGDEHVVALELQRGADGVELLLDQHVLEPLPGADVVPAEVARDHEALHPGGDQGVELVAADRRAGV